MQGPLNICGIGLRHPHYKDLITSIPQVNLLEIHPENFFARNSKLHNILEIVSVNYNLSFHAVSMSLGSTDDPNIDYLKRLKELIDKYRPHFISDHLSWSSVGNNYFHDLLPLPYNKESLELVKYKIDFVIHFVNFPQS